MVLVGGVWVKVYLAVALIMYALLKSFGVLRKKQQERKRLEKRGGVKLPSGRGCTKK